MNPKSPDRPHIVFLFSDTGGGHRSAASAIIEAIELEFPGQTTQDMVDILRDYAPPPIKYAPEIYPPLTRVPSVWGMGYHISDGPKRTQFIYRMIWPYIRWGLQRLIREHPCDLIVSVHPLPNGPMTRAFAASGRKIPYTTVVTDLVTTHAAWYTNQADLIIVPTSAAYRRAINHGISPDRMQVVGLPVADKFCRPVGDPSETRAILGWPKNIPIAILVGGGEGMGPLEETARAINDSRQPMMLVVIAGRNKKLKNRLEKMDWNMPTRIYGFVQEMPDFMRAADILITKAGPGTISEAFNAGLPMILYSRLPGQEDGNVGYVVDNGAGVWAPRPEAVAEAVRCWIHYPGDRQKAAKASLRLARPFAAREIARLLASQIRVLPEQELVK